MQRPILFLMVFADAKPAQEIPDTTYPRRSCQSLPPHPQDKRIKIQGKFGGTHRTKRSGFAYGLGSYLWVVSGE